MSKKKTAQTEASMHTEQPTEAAMRARAAALGDSFPRVKARSADLLTQANKLAPAIADVSELAARGYPVTHDHYQCVAILARMLTDIEVTQAIVAEDRKVKTAQAEAHRARLLVIRDLLARVGEAADLPESYFMVDGNEIATFRRGMLNMVGFVRKHQTQLADHARVEALLIEAETLLRNEDGLRGEGSELGVDRTEVTKTGDQIKRLLFDQMRHLSKQGLAAYPDDPKRELLYAWAWRPSKKSKKEAPEPTELSDSDVAA